ncbi:MAG: T9SS type A sorting domain-containing protein [Bacteroidetes bacterium]|nr:T9SS type A sorting domain-containing protein [Bacteroidota bacterium]
MTKTENVNRFVLHFTPKAEITAADANCSANGQIVIEQPGSASWQYQIQNSTTATISSGTLNNSNAVTASVPAGIYTVTLTDNNGYVVVKQVQVNGSSSITAAGNSSTQIAEVNEDITFSSSTANAVTTVWNFGDGTTANTATATHNYAQEGTYTVTLTVTNADGCSSTLTQTITVTEKMTVGNLETGPESWQVRVFPNPAIDKLFIELNNVTNTQVLITDVQGKRMLQADIQQQHYMVNVADWAAGIYLIKLNTGKHTKTIRVRVGQ